MKLGNSTQNHWPESCPRLMSSKTEFQIQPPTKYGIDFDAPYAFRVVSTVQAHMLYVVQLLFCVCCCQQITAMRVIRRARELSFFYLKLYALKLHCEYAISNGCYRIQMRVIALTLWLCELSAQSAQCVASMRCFFVVVGPNKIRIRFELVWLAC